MRRQRNMAQMKEKNKTPEKELNKTEISNLSGTEFKTLVMRVLKELIGCFNSIKKTQAEMKFTLSEIKKNLQGIDNAVDEAENQINDIWNICKKKHSIRLEKRKKNPKNKDKLTSLWDNFKCTNIRIYGCWQKRRSKKLKTYLKK